MQMGHDSTTAESKRTGGTGAPPSPWISPTPGYTPHKRKVPLGEATEFNQEIEQIKSSKPADEFEPMRKFVKMEGEIRITPTKKMVATNRVYPQQTKERANT